MASLVWGRVGGLQCTHMGSQGQSLYIAKLLPALCAFWPLPINPLYSDFYTPTPGSRNKRRWGCWWARHWHSGFQLDTLLPFTASLELSSKPQPMCCQEGYGLRFVFPATVHFGNESGHEKSKNPVPFKSHAEMHLAENMKWKKFNPTVAS